MTERHEMNMVQAYADGYEEWHCPTCGRRFLLQWQPYDRVVLVPGDENARHSGAKGVPGGVSLDVEATVRDDEGDALADTFDIWRDE